MQHPWLSPRSPFGRQPGIQTHYFVTHLPHKHLPVSSVANISTAAGNANVISFTLPHSRILNTPASCAFQTAVGRLEAMSHTTSHPSASLPLNRRQNNVPAQQSSVVPGKSTRRDFCDMTAKHVLRTWRKITRIYEPRLLLHNSTHLFEPFGQLDSPVHERKQGDCHSTSER